MKHWEESWKYDAQRLDELRGVSSGDQTLCQMLDITSQTKWFYQEKLRMQKWAVLHLISKHSLNINFLCIFYELLMSLRNTNEELQWRTVLMYKWRTSISCNSQITSLNDERGAVTLLRINKGQRLKRNTLFSPSNTINTILKKNNFYE